MEIGKRSGGDFNPADDFARLPSDQPQQRHAQGLFKPENGRQGGIGPRCLQLLIRLLRQAQARRHVSLALALACSLHLQVGR